MNLREFAVLKGINIAGAFDPGFWCTAEQIAETVKTYANAHFDDVRKVLGDVTTDEVGYVLRSLLTRGWGQVPLVEKRRIHGVNQWRQTDHASRVCIS